VVVVCHGLRFPGVAAHLIDPVRPVAATLHADNGAGMTGDRALRLAPPTWSELEEGPHLVTEPDDPDVTID